MDVISVLGVIGGAAGAIVTLITLTTLIFKPLRNRFIKWVRSTTDSDGMDNKIDDINSKLDQLTGLVAQTIEQNKKLQEDMDTLRLALQASLRNQILILYYDCRKKKYITRYEFECLNKLYENYINLGGNSFVKAAYTYITTQIEVRDD